MADRSALRNMLLTIPSATRGVNVEFRSVERCGGEALSSVEEEQALSGVEGASVERYGGGASVERREKRAAKNIVRKHGRSRA